MLLKHTFFLAKKNINFIFAKCEKSEALGLSHLDKDIKKIHIATLACMRIKWGVLVCVSVSECVSV